MNLYLVRHGEAVPASGATNHDADRILSPQGREDARAIGMVLSKADPAITAVLSSPLTRALETGELVTRELPSKPEITKTEHLCPGFRHKELLSQMNNLNHDSVMLIGHQPDMSTFLSLLIGDDQTTVEMATCAVALVHLSRPAGPRSGALRWLFTPELLRVLKTP